MHADIAAKHNYISIGWIRGLVHHINWFRDLDRQISCSEDQAIRSAVQRLRPSDQLFGDSCHQISFRNLDRQISCSEDQAIRSAAIEA